MQDKEYMRIQGIKHRATPKGKASILFRHAKHRSEKRQIAFDLDKNWIEQKIKNGKCELSNLNFDLTNSDNLHFNPFAPSIDKIDPKKGYTKDNCRIVLVCVNFGIGQWGIDVYTKAAKAVIHTQRYQNKQQIHT